MAMPIIDDDPASWVHIVPPPGKATGLVPRDYELFPETMFQPPSQMDLIPRSEWSDRIKEQIATKSRVSDIRNTALNGKPIPHLDQNGFGFCWSFSVTHCVMLTRAIANLPYVPLSAYAVASIIKGGRNEGGWCGLSAKFIHDVGVPSQAFWKEGTANIRQDTPELRANAALHKITEDWMDLTRAVHAQDLTFDQLASCLLRGQPCAVDYNHMSHSVCACDLVEVERGSYGVLFLNSWKWWGDNGFGILRGTKAVPDGALCVRQTTPSV